MLAENEWPVRLPSSLPSCQHCTFAWTWVNAIGNREYYSIQIINLVNCADIAITSNQKGSGIEGHHLEIYNLQGHPTLKPDSFNGGPKSHGTVIKYYPIEAK